MVWFGKAVLYKIAITVNNSLWSRTQNGLSPCGFKVKEQLKATTSVLLIQNSMCNMYANILLLLHSLDFVRLHAPPKGPCYSRSPSAATVLFTYYRYLSSISIPGRSYCPGSRVDCASLLAQSTYHNTPSLPNNSTPLQPITKHPSLVFTLPNRTIKKLLFPVYSINQFNIY